MDIQRYSRLLSCKINIVKIKKVIIDLNNTPEIALKRDFILFRSSKMKSGIDWNLYKLINDYLTNFRIPKESLDLIIKLEKWSNEYSESIDWLLNYNFNGQIITNSNSSSIFKHAPIIKIEAQRPILELIIYPIKFIINMVERCCELWSSSVDINLYFASGHNSELLNYIEKNVALCNKHFKQINSETNTFNGLYVTPYYEAISYDLPIPEEILYQAKEASLVVNRIF